MKMAYALIIIMLWFNVKLTVAMSTKKELNYLKYSVMIRSKMKFVLSLFIISRQVSATELLLTALNTTLLHLLTSLLVSLIILQALQKPLGDNVALLSTILLTMQMPVRIQKRRQQLYLPSMVAFVQGQQPRLLAVR